MIKSNKNIKPKFKILEYSKKILIIKLNRYRKIDYVKLELNILLDIINN